MATITPVTPIISMVARTIDPLRQTLNITLQDPHGRRHRLTVALGSPKSPCPACGRAFPLLSTGAPDVAALIAAETATMASAAQALCAGARANGLTEPPTVPVVTEVGAISASPTPQIVAVVGAYLIAGTATLASPSGVTASVPALPSSASACALSLTLAVAGRWTLTLPGASPVGFAVSTGGATSSPR